MRTLWIRRLLAAAALCFAGLTLVATPARGASGDDHGTIIVAGALDRDWVQFIGSSELARASEDPVTVSVNRLDLRFPADGGDVIGTFRFVADDTFHSVNGVCSRHHEIDARFAGIFTAATNTVHGTSSGSSSESIVTGCRGSGFKPVERSAVHGSWIGTLAGDRFVVKDALDKTSSLTFTAHVTAIGGAGSSGSSGSGAAPSSASTAPDSTGPAVSQPSGDDTTRTIGLVAAGVLGGAAVVAGVAYGLGSLTTPKYVPLGDQLAADALNDAIQDVEIASRTNPMVEALAREQMVEGLAGPQNILPLGSAPQPVVPDVQQRMTERAHHLLAQAAADPQPPAPGDGTGPEQIVQQELIEQMMRATHTPTDGRSIEDYAEHIRKHRPT